jgi:hypothetical protein
MNNKVRVVTLGDGYSFIFLHDAQGVRMVNLEHIKSMVPNFRLGGTMIFMTHSDKAITVDIDPEEIAAVLIK